MFFRFRLFPDEFPHCREYVKIDIPISIAYTETTQEELDHYQQQESDFEDNEDDIIGVSDLYDEFI